LERYNKEFSERRVVDDEFEEHIHHTFDEDEDEMKSAYQNNNHSKHMGMGSNSGYRQKAVSQISPRSDEDDSNEFGDSFGHKDWGR
jgi:hypothetical protein